jgi:hypothetical protein
VRADINPSLDGNHAGAHEGLGAKAHG